MNSGRQEIVLSIDSFKRLALNVTNDSSNIGIWTEFQQLLKLILEYHRLIIDDSEGGSNWLRELEQLIFELRDVIPAGTIVQSFIKSALLDKISDDNKIEKRSSRYSKDLEEMCRDLARESYYKILISDDESDKEQLNLYRIKEFCNTSHYKKGCLLLRRMKSIAFQSGDDTNRLMCIAPYIRYSSTVNFYDNYLFKSKFDWEIISLLLSYCINVKEVNFYSKFYNRKEDNLNNYLLSLEETYPDVKFFTKKYNFNKEHPREIKSDEFEIILDSSFMNFIFDKDDIEGRVIAEKTVNLTFK